MKSIFSALLLLISIASFSQSDSAAAALRAKPFAERIVWGGNIALSFGQLGSTIGVAPVAGYKLTERFIPGIGFEYYHNKFHDIYGNSWIQDVYGASVWGKYLILPKIFLAAEAEALNSDWDYSRPGHRYTLDTYLVGAGYREQYGNFSNYFQVMYVLNQLDAAYDSPLVIRAGFLVGF